MVGEMRDQETVEIGLRGALTGHLVLSTLHTNDAITSALRLIDMGAAGFLVGSSLRAVIAQRLVRRVCENCSQPYQLTSQEKMWLTNLAGEQADYCAVSTRYRLSIMSAYGLQGANRCF